MVGEGTEKGFGAGVEDGSSGRSARVVDQNVDVAPGGHLGGHGRGKGLGLGVVDAEPAVLLARRRGKGRHSGREGFRVSRQQKDFGAQFGEGLGRRAADSLGSAAD